MNRLILALFVCGLVASAMAKHPHRHPLAFVKRCAAENELDREKVIENLKSIGNHVKNGEPLDEVSDNFKVFLLTY